LTIVTSRTAALRLAAVPALIAAVTLTGCSGGSSSANGPSSGSTTTTSPAGTTATLGPAPSTVPAVTTQPGRTTKAGTPGRTSTAPTKKPAPTQDPIEAKITELEQSGGVPSRVVRVKGTTVKPAASVIKMKVGDTLRLILLVNTAAHVVGTGVGVEADIKALDPTAVDIFPTEPGTYEVKLTSPTAVRLLSVVAQ
jgi:hypothetical protein